MSENVKDTLRGAIFSKKNREPKKENIEIFGQQVEVRQPTIAQVTGLANSDDKTAGIIRLLIEYCYVPGTDVKLFTKADTDAIMELPAGKWLNEFNGALERLTSIDVKAAEKNSEETKSD